MSAAPWACATAASRPRRAGTAPCRRRSPASVPIGRTSRFGAARCASATSKCLRRRSLQPFVSKPCFRTGCAGLPRPRSARRGRSRPPRWARTMSPIRRLARSCARPRFAGACFTPCSSGCRALRPRTARRWPIAGSSIRRESTTRRSVRRSRRTPAGSSIIRTSPACSDPRRSPRRRSPPSYPAAR